MKDSSFLQSNFLTVIFFVWEEMSNVPQNIPHVIKHLEALACSQFLTLWITDAFFLYTTGMTRFSNLC